MAKLTRKEWANIAVRFGELITLAGRLVLREAEITLLAEHEHLKAAFENLEKEFEEVLAERNKLAQQLHEKGPENAVPN